MTFYAKYNFNYELHLEFCCVFKYFLWFFCPWRVRVGTRNISQDPEWVRLEQTSEVTEFSLFGTEGLTRWSEVAKGKLWRLGETKQNRGGCTGSAWAVLSQQSLISSPAVQRKHRDENLCQNLVKVEIFRNNNRCGVLEVGKQSHPSAFWGKSHNVEHEETELRA